MTLASALQVTVACFENMSSSSTVVIAELGADKSRHLSEMIKSKLAELSLYTDDVLPEYIMVLLANRNSREKVFEELSLFMGADTTGHFVLWLFGELEALARASTSASARVSVGEQQPPLLSTPAAAASSAPAPAHAPALAPTVAEDVQMNTTASRVQNSRSFSKAVESAVSSTRAPQRIEGRAPLSRAGADEDGTEGDTRRRVRSDRESRNDRVITRGSDSPRAVNVDGRGRVQKIRLAVDFDREERRKSRRRTDAHTEEDAEQSASAPATRVKCPYWPSCRAGDACPNAHPSEPCKHFPNCQFGDACVFIHPAILCRFQDHCQNPACNFQHPSPAFKPGRPGSANVALGTIQCRFHPRCVNPTCPYLHPVQAACRYGVECARADCPFEHPAGRKGAHLKSVVYAPCRYGKQCARADCAFQHESCDAVSVNMGAVTSMDVDGSGVGSVNAVSAVGAVDAVDAVNTVDTINATNTVNAAPVNVINTDQPMTTQ